MTAWDGIRDGAVVKARSDLREAGLAEEHVRDVTDLLGGAGFPGLLGLAGAGRAVAGPAPETGDRFVSGVADAVGREPEIAGRGLDAGTVRSLLLALLVERRSPRDVFSDPATRDAVLAAAMRALEAETGVSLSEEQRRSAVELLASGKLMSDVSTATATVLRAVPGIPVALVGDVRHAPLRLIRLGGAIALDLVGTGASVPQVAADLLSDGDLDRPPAVLAHTMRMLFGFASLRTTADTVGALLRNRSVRLAIVAYARANGVPVTEPDLDAVRTHVLETPNPDLGPLVAIAVTRLAERHGADQVMRILGRLGEQ